MTSARAKRRKMSGSGFVSSSRVFCELMIQFDQRQKFWEPEPWILFHSKPLKNKPLATPHPTLPPKTSLAHGYYCSIISTASFSMTEGFEQWPRDLTPGARMGTWVHLLPLSGGGPEPTTARQISPPPTVSSARVTCRARGGVSIEDAFGKFNGLARTESLFFFATTNGTNIPCHRDAHVMVNLWNEWLWEKKNK